MDRTHFKLLYRYARTRAASRDKYGAPEKTISDGLLFWFGSGLRGHRCPRVHWGPEVTLIRTFALLGAGFTQREPDLRRAFLDISRRQPRVPLP